MPLKRKTRDVSYSQTTPSSLPASTKDSPHALTPGLLLPRSIAPHAPLSPPIPTPAPVPSPAIESPTPPPKKNKRGGRVPGSQNFTDADRKRAFAAIRQTRPWGYKGWDLAAAEYNRAADAEGRKPRGADYLMRFFNHLVDGPEPGTIVSTAFNHPECIEEACSIKEEIARFVAGQREYTEAGDEAEERPGPKGDSDEVSHESDSDPARVAPSRAEILPPDLQSSPLQIQPESSRGRKGKSTSKAAITAEKLGPRLAAVASRSSTEVLDRIVNYLENSGISSEGLERALERSEARYERLDLRYERLEEKNHRLEGKHELLTQENSELKDANRELREKLAILTASGKNSPREGGGGDISDHAHNVPEHGLEGRQWF